MIAIGDILQSRTELLVFFLNAALEKLVYDVSRRRETSLVLMCFWCLKFYDSKVYLALRRTNNETTSTY